MRSSLYLSFVALGIALSGCTQPSNEWRTKYDTIGEAKRVMELTTATCDTATNCHPSVGSFLVRDASDVYACTTFFASPQMILTNKHCIPNNAQEKGSRFEHALIKLPAAQGFVPEIIPVTEVLDISKFSVADERIVQDWALLKLATPSRRAAIKISQSGAADGQTFSIYKFNPEQSRLRTSQELVKCIAAQAGQLLVDIADRKSPLLAMMNCKVVQGNSGSPILDSEGSARGIVSIRYTPRAKFGGLQAVHGIGTNFACVDMQLLGLHITDQESCRHL